MKGSGWGGEIEAALNRLAKWRTLFAGWQLGTRPNGDPECAAVKDHRELTILLRAEVSAMTAALFDLVPGFEAKFKEKLLREADLLNQDYEAKFPGVRATSYGLAFDPRAQETMRGWKQ